jgi:hypothetical protein
MCNYFFKILLPADSRIKYNHSKESINRCIKGNLCSGKR